MDKRLNEIALHHGLEEQLNQIVEECSELILAIQKYKRYGYLDDSYETYYLAQVGEELVDVEIMIDQLKLLIEGFDFDTFKNDKIVRELGRMKEAETQWKH